MAKENYSIYICTFRNSGVLLEASAFDSYGYCALMLSARPVLSSDTKFHGCLRVNDSHVK